MTTRPQGAANPAEKVAVLLRRLQQLGSLVVAFSGGTDSAFLLAAAVRALGPERVLAATSTSASLASGEWTAAARFAAGLRVRHTAVGTAELARDGYRANGPDRCFHCKAELLDRLLELARDNAMAAVATGTNADDLRAPHRPGLRAAALRGALTPLADAGLAKPEIRTVSRSWGLPTWDKPQAACLASRVAYGVAVDADRLARVDRAETAVRRELADNGINVVNLRVRDLGDRARLEVDREHVERVSRRPGVLAALRGAGFPVAQVDPRGFRSGSLNDALLPDQRIPGGGASSWDLPLVD